MRKAGRRDHPRKEGHQTGLISYSLSDAQGRPKENNDAQDKKSETEFDGEGRVTHSKDTQGNETWTEYDVFGRRYRERYHPANVTGEENTNTFSLYYYDEVGRIAKTERRRDSVDGELLSRTEKQYIAGENGRSETTIDTIGRRSVSHHDKGGRLTLSESFDAQGNLTGSTSYEYDALGRTLRTTNELGIVNENFYDDLGRAIKTIASGGVYNLVTEYGYSDGGKQMWTLAPNGMRTRNEYDDLGRLSKIYVDPAGSEPEYLAQEIEYDTQGRQWKVWEYSDAVNKTATVTGYDALGRANQTTLGYVDDITEPGLLFEFDFDIEGKEIAFRDPLFNLTTYPSDGVVSHKKRDRRKTYDEEGRIEWEFGPLCTEPGNPSYNKRQATKYEYLESGNLHQKYTAIP